MNGPKPISGDPPRTSEKVLDRVRSRHARTIARFISGIENGDPSVQAVLSAIGANAGKAQLVGVTGVPGAGKSTLVPALAQEWASAGIPVAILAVDPSSPLTGGAILGDRIRNEGGEAANIFFRSLASRGDGSGLSRALHEIVELLDGAGFGVILIETVGTGQSEIAITELADTTLLLTAPGLGDEIQAMKAGILEVADIVVVNKSDANPAGARTTALTLRQSLAEATKGHGLQEGVNCERAGEPMRWHPPVREVSALTRTGTAELVALIEAHRRYLDETGQKLRRTEQRRRGKFAQELREALFRIFSERRCVSLEEHNRTVASGSVSPRAAAEAAAWAAIREEEEEAFRRRKT